MSQRRAVTPLCAALLVAGCAEVAFSPHFADNKVTDLKAAMQRSANRKGGAPSNATGKPLAFVVGTDSLLAVDLQAGSTLWKVSAEVTSRVVVGRQLVFHRSGANTLVGRSVQSGRVAWSIPLKEGTRLVGMAADGDRVYYVSETTGRAVEKAVAHLVGVDGSSGKTLWDVPSAGRLGAPSARDNLVFLPLRYHSVAVIDGDNGHELARVRNKEESLFWVRAMPDAVLFGGQSGVYKLDDRSVIGTKLGSSYAAPTLPGAVRPVWWWDGYNAALAGYTAYDRNRLLWKLDPAEMKFQSDTLYIHNYRFFFAVDVGSDKAALRWAYSYPRHDAVASAFTGGSLVFVTDHGELVTLDPKRGLPKSTISLRTVVRGATFDADGFEGRGSAVGHPSDLRQTLREVIWDPDRRFVQVKLFCIEQLAKLGGGQVSEELLKVVTRPGIDPAVYKRAGELLVARKDRAAVPMFLEALRARYSFIDGTEAKAVDVLARALGELKVQEAVRPLLLHLADHETSLTAVAEIVRALTMIGDRTVVEPLRDYLLTYRCEPEMSRVPAALNLVAEGLLKLGGDEVRQLLGFVQNDTHTLASLRTYLGEALSQSSRKPGRKPGKVKPPTVTKPKGSASR